MYYSVFTTFSSSNYKLLLTDKEENDQLRNEHDQEDLDEYEVPINPKTSKETMVSLTVDKMMRKLLLLMMKLLRLARSMTTKPERTREVMSTWNRTYMVRYSVW